MGIPTGTIFGIYEEPEGCIIDANEDGVVDSDEMRDCLSATLQEGNKLVVAGYCLYSAATSFVFSFGGKTCQGFTLDESVGEFVLTQPNMQVPTRGKPIYSINEANRWQWEPELRDYITAIQKGEGEIKNPNGKLRLLYEAAPIAFLDITPSVVHQRV